MAARLPSAAESRSSGDTPATRARVRARSVAVRVPSPWLARSPTTAPGPVPALPSPPPHAEDPVEDEEDLCVRLALSNEVVSLPKRPDVRLRSVAHDRAGQRPLERRFDFGDDRRRVLLAPGRSVSVGGL